LLRAGRDPGSGGAAAGALALDVAELALGELAAVGQVLAPGQRLAEPALGAVKGTPLEQKLPERDGACRIVRVALEDLEIARFLWLFYHPYRKG
jgi:hypothetical protein